METHSTNKDYVRYNHSDPCRFSRWTARESYQFMYGRPWQQVLDFYSNLVNGTTSFSSLFPLHKKYQVDDDDYDAEIPEISDDKVKLKKSEERSGRWARVTFKVVLGYNGASFDGWQKQPGLNTVQGLVERSLGRFVDEKKAQLLKDKCLPLEACAAVAGRTDKGVTALQQVCSFYTWRKDITCQDIEEAINNAAPGKLKAKSVSEVSRVFHPNFSAKWRRYLYIFPFNDEEDEEQSNKNGENLETYEKIESGCGEWNDESFGNLIIDDSEELESRKKPSSFSVSRVDQLLRLLEGKLLSYKMFARDTKASRNEGPPTECFIYHARAAEARLPTSNNSALFPTWKASTSPCTADEQSNWEGVLCSQGKIWGLKLENMGLKGTIDLDSLKNLPNLRTISLMNNNFDGPLPDIGQLGSLKTVYLSNNKFSGVIDSDIFLRTLSLKKVHLAYNQFTGGIPSSLAFLPKLKELRLEGNQFEGLIPNFPRKTWLSFNVSNNALGGHIPLGLSTLDASSFYENQDLCGPPLKPCSLHKFSVFSLVIVVIVVLMALSAICAVIFILSHRRQTSTTTEEDSTQPKTEQAEDENLSPRRSLAASSSATAKRGESTKLVSVRDDREKFDMQDLLRASAEILGSGNFGSSYKAALLSGTVMVVKRFKQMNNVGREEFQQHMRRIGRLRHRNVLPLVAYYYRKEEKLLVSDYVQKGSLAVHLYGGQGGGSLDWRTRLKIIKGVANGLKYLHTELPTLIAAHGHLKPSNVLLNESYEPLLSDYALIPITNQEHAQQLMVAYKSPEYLQHGRITKKTDIWSLGILILEILTGKPPEYGDLVKWVSSKADGEEEELNEVFNGELLKAGPTSNTGEEREVLVKLLRIGMECCDVDVEKRLDVKEAADKIEELKEIISTADHHKTSGTSTTYNRVGDIDDFYSTCASEMDMRSSRALSDEFLNFNVKLG